MGEVGIYSNRIRGARGQSPVGRRRKFRVKNIWFMIHSACSCPPKIHTLKYPPPKVIVLGGGDEVMKVEHHERDSCPHKGDPVELPQTSSM